MLGQSILPYFFFGTVFRFLQDATSGHQIAGDGWVLDNIDTALDTITELNLQVTAKAAWRLQILRGKLQEAKGDPPTLTQQQASDLRDIMIQLRHTCQAELEGFLAYVVTPKRLNTDKLTGDVASLLAPKTYPRLPDIAKYDLTEAGKCIAFERPTAAAFHLLRATESALKTYYCFMIRRDRVDLMWGPMVADMRRRKKTQAKTTLLNHLDNIRLSFRNPTQHPDKIYDIEEVQDLWGLCADALTRMMAEMPD